MKGFKLLFLTTTLIFSSLLFAAGGGVNSDDEPTRKRLCFKNKKQQLSPDHYKISANNALALSNACLKAAKASFAASNTAKKFDFTHIYLAFFNLNQAALLAQGSLLIVHRAYQASLHQNYVDKSTKTAQDCLDSLREKARYATSSADSIKVCDFSVSLSDTIEHIRVFLNVKDSLAFLLSPAANTAFSPSSI